MASAGDDMAIIGEELRAHGHFAAGRTLCERRAAWYRTRPPSEQGQSDFRYSAARSSYCAERWDEARVEYSRLADEVSTSPAGMYFRTVLGALAARRGDSAEVTRIDQWLAIRDTMPIAPYAWAAY